MQDYNNLLNKFGGNIEFSERAKRDIERAHFTEDKVLEILKSPKNVKDKDKGYLVMGEKTAKIVVKVMDDNKLLIESFSYNQVPFVF